MNLGDLTSFVEKPFAAVSDILNTPNSAGRYRPFYLRNLLDGGTAGSPGLRFALESSLWLTFASMFAIALLVGVTAVLVPRVTFLTRGAPAE